MSTKPDRERAEATIEALACINPEALTPDGLENAVIGYADRQFGGPPVAVVSIKAAVQILVERDGMDADGAREFLEHNAICAWLGDNTPIWIEEP